MDGVDGVKAAPCHPPKIRNVNEMPFHSDLASSVGVAKALFEGSTSTVSCSTCAVAAAQHVLASSCCVMGSWDARKSRIRGTAENV